MQIQLNKWFLHNRHCTFKVDSVFKVDQMIIPAPPTSSYDKMDLKRKKVNSCYAIKTKNPPAQTVIRHYSPEKKMRSKSKQAYYTPGPISKKGLLIQNSLNQQKETATDSSTRSGSPSGGTIRKESFKITDSSERKTDVKTNYTQIMHDRWLKSLKAIPEVDRKDIMEENPSFNNGATSCPRHQHHPEFTQQSYLRLRTFEEAFHMGNYLDVQMMSQIINQKRASFISPDKKASALRLDQIMNANERAYGMQILIDLHEKKEYKIETLFLAANIFDRYICSLGLRNFPKQQIAILSTISILMAAKLDQPMSPNFQRMINLLTEDEQKIVHKQGLMNLEAHILVTLGFEFNFPGPIQSSERFLRILDYDLDRNVKKLCFIICKYQLYDAKFLNYRPSQIAACACILAININEKQIEKESGLTSVFFKDCSRQPDGLQDLNLSIWNNEQIHTLSGYSLDDIRKCLLELSIFMSSNLTPNRLEDFNLASISTEQQYYKTNPPPTIQQKNESGVTKTAIKQHTEKNLYKGPADNRIRQKSSPMHQTQGAQMFSPPRQPRLQNDIYSICTPPKRHHKFVGAQQKQQSVFQKTANSIVFYPKQAAQS